MAFLLMISDLLEDEKRIKFVDDTMTRELCYAPGNDSKLQSIANNTTGYTIIIIVLVVTGKHTQPPESLALCCGLGSAHTH